MYKILLLLIASCFLSNANAQVLPQEGSTLNYRIVGFKFPPKPGATGYKIEVAAGIYNNEDSFRKNIIKTVTTKTNKITADVPSFGKDYTWRVLYSPSNAKQAELHHFSTGYIPELDTNDIRIRTIKSSKKYKDAVFFIDGVRALYDMSGRPVWYLPSIKGVSNENLDHIRDIKLSSKNTITFLLDDDAYEISYDGTILWKTPRNGTVSGDSLEHVHHEFTRLANGHYMVLGKEYIYWELPSAIDTNLFRYFNVIWDGEKKLHYQKLEFGTVIEYDKDGKVVWQWKSSGFFRKGDPKPGLQRKIELSDSHENSFYFDEKTKMVYVGFRNLSRILKIKYPEGTVVNSYKNIQKPAPGDAGGLLFCNQHAAKISDKGYLYVFNNNLCQIGAPPKVIMMQEPVTPDGDLKRVWEIDCPLFGVPPGTQLMFVAGGNVIELPDHSIFTSLYGDGFSNIFIVAADRTLQWSVSPEKWNKNEKRWTGIDMYRASIITDKKKLDGLIWGDQK